MGHDMARNDGRSVDQLRSATAGPAEHQFLATGDAKSFESLARRFLGPEVGHVRHQDLS